MWRTKGSKHYSCCFEHSQTLFSKLPQVREEAGTTQCSARPGLRVPKPAWKQPTHVRRVASQAEQVRAADSQLSAFTGNEHVPCHKEWDHYHHKVISCLSYKFVLLTFFIQCILIIFSLPQLLPDLSHIPTHPISYSFFLSPKSSKQKLKQKKISKNKINKQQQQTPQKFTKKPPYGVHFVQAWIQRILWCAADLMNAATLHWRKLIFLFPAVINFKQLLAWGGGFVSTSPSDAGILSDLNLCRSCVYWQCAVTSSVSSDTPCFCCVWKMLCPWLLESTLEEL